MDKNELEKKPSDDRSRKFQYIENIRKLVKELTPEYRKWFIYGLSIGVIFVFIILLAVYKIGDGWLGFWGSALGVVGAFLILKEQINYDSIAMKKQLDEEKEQSKRQQIDNTFFNLLSLHNEQLNVLKEADMFNLIDVMFKEKLRENLLEAGLIYFDKEKEMIKSVLNDVKEKYEFYLNVNEDKLAQPLKDKYKLQWKKGHKALFYSGETSTVQLLLYSNMADATQKIISIEDYISGNPDAITRYIYEFFPSINEKLKSLSIDVPEEFQKLLDKIDVYSTSKNYNLLNDSQRKKSIEDVLNTYYSTMGSYFRLFHRIIKYLNDNVKDTEALNNYLGFLRSTINQDELLVIFYNAAYTTRGKGLLHELKKTTFFGNEEDIKNNQHFDTNELFWRKDDTDIMLNKNNDSSSNDVGKEKS
ncbi:TPA: putative phage abortive infection protein [Enterococcus faecium]